MENKKVYESISNIINEIEAVKKKSPDDPNAYGSVKYSYRRIDDFMNALSPLMGKHGLTLLPEVLEVDRSIAQTKNGGTMNYVKIKSKYTLYAKDGSFISGITIGEAFDSGDKASGKAQSNALKYFIMPTFMVPTEDIDDTDGHDVELEKQQVKTTTKQTPPIKPPLKNLVPQSNEYILKFGKVKGKTLSQLGNDVVINYFSHINAKPDMLSNADLASDYKEIENYINKNNIVPF